MENKYCLFCKNSMSADEENEFSVLICFDCKGYEGREMIVDDDGCCENYKEN